MPPGSKCACIAKLAQLHTTVLDELHPCKEQVYESRISQLLGTIDALQLKNDDLRTELADLHSKIASDPFLSSRLQGVLSKLQNGSSRVYGSDFHAETNATALYRQLTILEDRNRELESRLSMEYAVSMSWKHKIQDIEHRLREQLDDLVGETRDVSCLKDSDAVKSRSDKREALSKEAFDLLKLARIRIADDKNRIDSFVARIADLEKELLEHRLRHPDLTNQTVSTDIHDDM